MKNIFSIIKFSVCTILKIKKIFGFGSRLLCISTLTSATYNIWVFSSFQYFRDFTNCQDYPSIFAGFYRIFVGFYRLWRKYYISKIQHFRDFTHYGENTCWQSRKCRILGNQYFRLFSKILSLTAMTKIHWLEFSS